jgi:DNA-binding protein YbaB
VVTDSPHPHPVDPFDQFTAFTEELDGLRAKAEKVQEEVRNATATARSRDGAVSVTVGPAGALVDLTFTAQAYRQPPETLAALVLSLAERAQRQVGAEVSRAYADLVGESSPAMSVLEEFLPADTGREDPDPRERRNSSLPRPYRPSGRRRPAADTDDFDNSW